MRKSWAEALRATVALSKREHSKNRVEAMLSTTEIFKLMQWSKPTLPKVPPPLLNEGRLVPDQADQAVILRSSLLTRYSESEDMPPCLHSSGAQIQWEVELTEIEVRNCAIGSGNTSPGADKISVELIASCWDKIGTYVTQLFQVCLRLDYHPLCFKLAGVVFLPKAGRDPASAKEWRPIAHLYCLGKGLERLIAKRMSHLAISYDVVGHQQFGALPKSSATDLISCVVHDIEEAHSQGWASRFVTMDIQGTFNAVLDNRLLWRRKAQGWPDFILRWTTSFLHNRKGQVRHHGGLLPRQRWCVACPRVLRSHRYSSCSTRQSQCEAGILGRDSATLMTLESLELYWLCWSQ